MTTRAGDEAPTPYERDAPELFDRTARQYDWNFDAPTVYGHCHRARLAAAACLVGPGPRRLGLTSLRMPAHRRPPRSTAAAAALVEQTGLRVEAIECVGCMVLPQIGARERRSLAVRVAEAAEARPLARRLFATQVLVTARKDG